MQSRVFIIIIIFLIHFDECARGTHAMYTQQLIGLASSQCISVNYYIFFNFTAGMFKI